MKKFTLVCAFLALTTLSSGAKVKSADLAGSWYPASGVSLRSELQSYLGQASPPGLSGEPVALISPHAGFMYSGPVAAYGFKSLKGMGIHTVIVVGFSHRQDYDGIALLDADGFRTPLGTVLCDREIGRELMEKSSKIYSSPEAFSGENSVELQIPYLQIVLGEFRVVLIAIGKQSLENLSLLGNALYETLKEKNGYLIVASTDMSHYLEYDKANEVDRNTISVIEQFDPDRLYAASASVNNSLMCGQGAVIATMIAAKKLGADEIKVLKYANSGDTAGDKSRVVGYLSAALIASSPKEAEGENNMLNEAQRKNMLSLARETIVHYTTTGKILEVTEDDPVLKSEMGAFVTLHKDGRLRGCIGNMIGRGPLYLTIRDMAIQAATGDPRFTNVTSEEMKAIDIEISVLSPLEKINDPEKIIMGKHGVIVKNASTSGVYLPQVATETGWTREEFMNSLCGQKAGMAPDSWRTGKCEIYVFTAEVFSE